MAPTARQQHSLDFGDQAQTCADRLQRWPSDLHGLGAGWSAVVQAFLASTTGRDLSARLMDALATGKTIYPREPLRALKLTPLNEVRVVILGQDPYHGPGQAEGLAFSVAPGVKIPPSLRNIYKELNTSMGMPMPKQGSLVHWAEQGVLLLNTCLTVEQGRAASHARWGWEKLTDDLIDAVAKQQKNVVFMLWGAHAQTKRPLIEKAGTSNQHLILQANHPSPLSAMRMPMPFLGCAHFALANAHLKLAGIKAIQW